MPIIINKPLGYKCACPDCNCIVGFKKIELTYDTKEDRFFIECPNCKRNIWVKDKKFYDNNWLSGVEPWYGGD